MRRIDELEAQFARHPTLPKEAVIKADLLRTGVRFERGALVRAPEIGAVGSAAGERTHQPKSYFIFSFDMVRQQQLDDEQKWHAPEEIALTGGRYGLRRTIISTRLNPASPYRVAPREGALWLHAEDEPLAEVGLHELPAHYRATLPNGKPVAEIAPTIEWGYLLYLTVFRVCQYFGAHEECQFCDINNNYRQQIQEGRPYTGVKSVADIVAALEMVDASGSESQAYTLTGGSVTSSLQGKNEVEFYSQYVEAIESRFPGRWISKVVTQAWPAADVRRLKSAGAQIYHPNYEVWDPELFPKICPGKTRYVGRDEWIRRIVDAGEVFGPANVIPNFVAGVEMARPYGYEDVERAIASTAEGLNFFMSKGITPRFTTWCPEPMTPLGDANPDGAPLEYHLRLLETYRDTLTGYHLAPPPGYGEPGPGRAVFSVSPFMDVLEPVAQPAIS
ncbi:MAG TPA: radical SAM protein [Ktedonobacterales bacterium]|nr:radical SAM protein [Ktedonobacterales bacterium]